MYNIHTAKGKRAENNAEQEATAANNSRTLAQTKGEVDMSKQGVDTVTPTSLAYWERKEAALHGG